MVRPGGAHFAGEDCIMLQSNLINRFSGLLRWYRTRLLIV
jgi:hypothetical protein